MDDYRMAQFFPYPSVQEIAAVKRDGDSISEYDPWARAYIDSHDQAFAAATRLVKKENWDDRRLRREFKALDRLSRIRFNQMDQAEFDGLRSAYYASTIE